MHVPCSFQINSKLAAHTGVLGADIANVCNEAALHAMWHGYKHVKECDFKSIIKCVIAG